MNSAPSFDDDDLPTDEELEQQSSTRTDAANADAFVRAHPDTYRFVGEWEAWIAWDGTRWALPGGKAGARDAVLQAIVRCTRVREHAMRVQLVKLSAELLELEAQRLDTDEIEARIEWTEAELKHLVQSLNSSRVNACEALARGRLGIAMAVLDQHPMLFNVQNGTIDLRTGILRDHARSDYLTQLAPIDYDPSALAPTWEQFLFRAMADDQELVTFLRRLVGYTLTGKTNEQCLAFHHGHTGGNGKSTFLGAVRDLMGEYACAAPRTLLFEGRAGAQPHPTELARLYGKRLATCSEVPEEVEIAEAKVKDLTGGDVLPVRRMNENFWDLHPTHKLHMAGNHKPIVKGTDGGIWRRIRLVPWLVMIPEHERDGDLPAKLRAELPGILAWAVMGCLEWQQGGLRAPADVVDASNAYRGESDLMADFFGALVFEPNAVIAASTIYAKYETWARTVGLHVLSAVSFGRRLRTKGASAKTFRLHGKPTRGWHGVRFATTEEMAKASAHLPELGDVPQPMYVIGRGAA